jgi:hypothetical protein
MIRRTSGRCRGLASALLLATLLTACGRDDGQRILGHWRADRLQVQSVSLPMGPEFVVTPELMSAEGDIRIPISSIEAEGEVVTLGAPSASACRSTSRAPTGSTSTCRWPAGCISSASPTPFSLPAPIRPRRPRPWRRWPRRHRPQRRRRSRLRQLPYKRPSCRHPWRPPRTGPHL